MRVHVHRSFLAGIACVSALAVALPAQTPSGVLPSFEVASIKPNTSGDGRALLGFPGGRFTATNVPVRALIASAYGDPQALPNFRIIGGPGWIDSERFDILAKPEGGFQRDLDAPSGGPAPAQIFLMLRSLLIERFKLVTHIEKRELPVYDLVLARSDGKLGPQLKKSDVDCAAYFASRRGGPLPPPVPGERLVCGMFGSPGRISGGSVNMEQLTTLLSRMVNLGPLRIWYLALLGLLALAVTSTLRSWPWPLRLLLHVSWLLSLILLTVLVSKGVLTIEIYGPG